MSTDTTLVRCPLCGADKGYTLNKGSTHRWWLPVCLGCGEQIGECRSDPDLPHTALVPDRWGLADSAWNSAGAHAQGLRDEIARMRSAALELDRLMLVLESAVRHSDPRNHEAVMALILANHENVTRLHGAALLADLKEPK